MGLPYPGGPQLAKLAETGTPGVFQFSRPMTDRPRVGFQFQRPEAPGAAGLARDNDQTDATKATSPAASKTRWSTLAIKCERRAGGGRSRCWWSPAVSVNRRLRAAAGDGGEARRPGLLPRPELCTDNGAMIAFAGAVLAARGRGSSRRDDAAVRHPPLRWDALRATTKPPADT